MCFLKNTNFSIRIFYLIEMFSCGNFVALYKHFQLLVFTLKWCNKKLKTYENIQFFCVSNWRDTTLFIVKKVQKKYTKLSEFFRKKSVTKISFFHPRIIGIFSYESPNNRPRFISASTL